MLLAAPSSSRYRRTKSEKENRHRAVARTDIYVCVCMCDQEPSKEFIKLIWRDDTSRKLCRWPHFIIVGNYLLAAHSTGLCAKLPALCFSCRADTLLWWYFINWKRKKNRVRKWNLEVKIIFHAVKFFRKQSDVGVRISRVKIPRVVAIWLDFFKVVVPRICQKRRQRQLLSPFSRSTYVYAALYTYHPACTARGHYARF